MINSSPGFSATKYLILSGCMLLCGMIFYGFYNNLIIIRLPYKTQNAVFEHRAHRQHTPLWFWNGEKFISEDKELIISSDTQKTLKDLVSMWLTHLEEEQGLAKMVAVQSVMLDLNAQTAFISFDRSPFKRAQSTFLKLMFLEGLLKTLKESSIPMKKIQFLVNHAPLQDRHLDFSHPWTLEGYLTT